MTTARVAVGLGEVLVTYDPTARVAVALGEVLVTYDPTARVSVALGEVLVGPIAAVPGGGWAVGSVRIA